MNLLERATVRETGMQRPRVSPIRLSLDCEQTGRISDGTDRNTEHVLKLTVACSFWANRAQYQDALRVAKEVVTRETYRDVWHLTASLRSALMSHDIERALQIVDAIDEQIGL